jgi:PRC-barrel domain
VRDVLLTDVPGAGLEDQYAVVPWSGLALPTGSGPVKFNMTRAEVDASPRLHAFTIATASRPEVTAQIFSFDPLERAAPPPLPAANPAPGQTEVPAPDGSTTVGPPILVSANALRGVPVATQDGRPLGEIGQAVIDTAHGFVAYVLIAEGGLRAPRAWLPAPIQILTASGQGYALAVADFWLRQIPPLPGPQTPGAVSTDWLRGLYDLYDVPPYW